MGKGRGKGPLYDKKGNKRRGKGSCGKGFVQIQIGMMQSPAWQSLSGNAAKVFMAMASKHWAFNGELAFSCQQAADVINRDRSTGGRVLKELEEKGFIVEEATAKFGATGRLAKEWRLTPFPIERNKKILRPATKDYQRWRPTVDKPEVAKKKQNACATGAPVCSTDAPNPLVSRLSEALRVTGAS